MHSKSNKIGIVSHDKSEVIEEIFNHFFLDVVLG